MHTAALKAVVVKYDYATFFVTLYRNFTGIIATIVNTANYFMGAVIHFSPLSVGKFRIKGNKFPF